MGCSATLSNISLGCLKNAGGVKAILYTNYENIKTKTLDSTTGKITAITLETDKKWYKIEFQKQNSQLTSTRTIDATNGVAFVTSNLTVNVKKMGIENRKAVEAICQADTAWLVKDQNDQVWFLGYDNPVTASANTSDTGMNLSDPNQYVITVQDMSQELPFNCSDDVWETAEGTVA
mgnify:FL=1